MRLQIILQLSPNPNLGTFFENLTPVLLPVLWFDAEAAITEEIADQLNIVGKYSICMYSILSIKIFFWRHNAHSGWNSWCCIISDWNWAFVSIYLQDLQQKETDGYRAEDRRTAPKYCVMSHETKFKSSIARKAWVNQIRLFPHTCQDYYICFYDTKW